MPLLSKIAVIAAPTAVAGLAGGWWAIAKRLPALDDEEWPYVGASLRTAADPAGEQQTERLLTAA